MDSTNNDNLQEPMDFSDTFADLMDDSVGAGIDALIRKAGLDDMSPEEYDRMAQEQENAKQVAGVILDMTSMFMDRLEDTDTIPQLREFAEYYFNLILPYYFENAGLDEENSNVVKTINRLEEEIENFCDWAMAYKGIVSLGSKRYEAIKRKIANFSMMLGMVKKEGNWEDLERGVSEIMEISTGVNDCIGIVMDGNQDVN
jgi:hypothetical protein